METILQIVKGWTQGQQILVAILAMNALYFSFKTTLYHLVVWRHGWPVHETEDQSE